MRHLSTDLETALAFVIEQISEEAVRSGAPLDEIELDFLRHLPAKRTNLTAYHGYYDNNSLPVLRDFTYERLCTLAKNARLHDILTRPAATRDWEFSAAVFQLERHPMSWLLNWAGMKKRQPRGDGLLLVGTALLVVLIFIFGAIALSVITEGRQEFWKRTLLIAGGCVYGVIVVLLVVAAQRFESWRLRQAVEKYKSARPELSHARELLAKK
jgi:hypothetical protein